MTKWLQTAPKLLVRRYEISAHKKGSINNGRAMLFRLLSDDRMKTTWTELSNSLLRNQHNGKTQPKAKAWMRIWEAICFAKLKSNQATKRKLRTDERDAYEGLASTFHKLAQKIENGPLDVLAYEIFPKDVLSALGIENLHEMDPLERSNIARTMLHCWPTASELLSGLEKCASKLADEAMNAQRADVRDTGNIKQRVFIFHLGQEFKAIFGECKIGSLAKITDVTFDLNNELSKSYVQGVLRNGGV